jgi:anti-anti-sigma factor
VNARLLPEPFRCDVVPERDRVRVALVGELDMATAPQLERTLRESLDAGFDHVVVDLGGLEFIDSTGLAVLLDSHGAAGNGSFRLDVWPGSPAVRRIFELTGALDVLSFVWPLARERALK